MKLRKGTHCLLQMLAVGMLCCSFCIDANWIYNYGTVAQLVELVKSWVQRWIIVRSVFAVIVCRSREGWAEVHYTKYNCSWILLHRRSIGSPKIEFVIFAVFTSPSIQAITMQTRCNVQCCDGRTPSATRRLMRVCKCCVLFNCINRLTISRQQIKFSTRELISRIALLLYITTTLPFIHSTQQFISSNICKLTQAMNSNFTIHTKAKECQHDNSNRSQDWLLNKFACGLCCLEEFEWCTWRKQMCVELGSIWGGCTCRMTVLWGVFRVILFFVGVGGCCLKWFEIL